MLELNCSALSIGPIDNSKGKLRQSNSTHNTNSSFLAQNSNNTKSVRLKKYEVKIGELLSIISNLNEDKAKLSKDNQRFKDENTELHKINKELLTKITNQKKHLDSLHIMLSRHKNPLKVENLPSLSRNKGINLFVQNKRPASYIRGPRSCSRLSNLSFDDIQIHGVKNK